MTKLIKDEIRYQLENFYPDYLRDSYRNYTGESSVTNYYRIFNKYAIFSDPDFISSIKRSISDEGTNNITDRLVFYFLSLQRLFMLASSELDGINQIECKLSGNSEITARNIGRLIRSGKKSGNREHLSNLRSKIRGELDIRYKRILDIFNSELESSGYKSISQLYSSSHHYFQKGMQEISEKFLSDTDYIYNDLLKWYFRKKTDAKVSDLMDYDLDFFFNSFELRQYFPLLELKYILERSFGEMKLVNTRRISFNTEKNINKVTAEGLFPVSPSSELYVSVYPESGLSYYMSLFRVFGMALLFMDRDEESTFEYRYIIDPVLLNIFGNIFRSLPLNTRWLVNMPFNSPDEDILRFMYLKYLRDLRLKASLVLYESTLLGEENDQNLKDIFAENFQRATGSRTSGEGHMEYIKCPYYVTEDFTGALLAPEINMYLVESFDEQWWRVPECGNYLQGLAGTVHSSDISFLQKDIKLESYNLNLLYEQFNKVF